MKICASPPTSQNFHFSVYLVPPPQSTSSTAPALEPPLLAGSGSSRLWPLDEFSAFRKACRAP